MSHCVSLRMQVGGREQTVCLVAPGNEHIAEEAKRGVTRPPAEYTDEEIARAMDHHLTQHGHDVPAPAQPGRDHRGAGVLWED